MQVVYVPKLNIWDMVCDESSEEIIGVFSSLEKAEAYGMKVLKEYGFMYDPKVNDYWSISGKYAYIVIHEFCIDETEIREYANGAIVKSIPEPKKGV